MICNSRPKILQRYGLSCLLIVLKKNHLYFILDHLSRREKKNSEKPSESGKIRSK